MGKDVIIACDFSTAEQTYAFLDRFTDRKPFIKIGMELFYAEGPDIVRNIKKRGHGIFLDLNSFTSSSSSLKYSFRSYAISLSSNNFS